MGVSTATMSMSRIENSYLEKADGIYLSAINISRSKQRKHARGHKNKYARLVKKNKYIYINKYIESK